MSNSSVAQENIQLPQPIVRIVPIPGNPPQGGSVAGTGMGGENYNLTKGLAIKLLDLPDNFYLNEDLDARVELLRYINRGKKKKGFKHPSQWIGQVNENDDGRKTRGGSQYDTNGITQPAVQTEWKIFGKQETQEIDVSGSLMRWWTTVQGETIDGNTKQLPSYTGTYKNAEKPISHAHPYGGFKPTGYFAFRYTVKNPDGDGTKGDRLVGPQSKTIQMILDPFPLFKNGDDEWDLNDVNSFTLRH